MSNTKASNQGNKAQATGKKVQKDDQPVNSMLKTYQSMPKSPNITAPGSSMKKGNKTTTAVPYSKENKNGASN